MIVQYSFFGYFNGLLIARPCQIVLCCKLVYEQTKTELGSFSSTTCSEMTVFLGIWSLYSGEKYSSFSSTWDISAGTLPTLWLSS